MLLKRAKRDLDAGKTGGKLDLGVESPKLIIGAPQYLKRVRVRGGVIEACASFEAVRTFFEFRWGLLCPPVRTSTSTQQAYLNARRIRRLVKRALRGCFFCA